MRQNDAALLRNHSLSNGSRNKRFKRKTHRIERPIFSCINKRLIVGVDLCDGGIARRTILPIERIVLPQDVPKAKAMRNNPDSVIGVTKGWLDE